MRGGDLMESISLYELIDLLFSFLGILINLLGLILAVFIAFFRDEK